MVGTRFELTIGIAHVTELATTPILDAWERNLNDVFFNANIYLQKWCSIERL